jgi:hypothetical protein
MVMRKRTSGNPKLSREDLRIELITDDFLICENLIHKRQS